MLLDIDSAPVFGAPPSVACKKLDDDERADVNLNHTSANGTTQRRKLAAVSESGLYALILRSNKPEAKKFRKWVTSEVFPEIRKKGSLPDVE